MGQSALQHNADLSREITPALSALDGYEGLARQGDDGRWHLSLLVKGIYCAACIQKIEGVLNAQEAVESVRLNFSTGQLNITWQGENMLANDFARDVVGQGYDVLPYDAALQDSESKKQERFLLLCLGVAGFAAGNIMLLSVGLWTTDVQTMGPAMREFLHLISALIAVPTILFAGRPFFRSALGVLRQGHTNMDVPISLALCLATGMSLYETFTHGEHVYFDSAVMLMFFLLIGRYLDFRARKQAHSGAADLLAGFTGFAQVREKTGVRSVYVRDLQEGMDVIVHAGEKFPADGVIIEGKSTVDTALITGESVPRDIEVGHQAYAGTVNMDAPVVMRVEKAAHDSLVADIAALMDKATQAQAKYVRLADRAAKLYTPVVHSLGALAFLGWWLIGGLLWQDALMISVTVLIITCPCALGLAVPVVQVLAIGKLMKNGILVKSGDALERLASVNMALFDKTGTLTLGQPLLSGTYDPKILKLAASLASHSAHPLSQALLAAYDGPIYALKNIEELPGQGIQALYRGKQVRLGSRRWCGDQTGDSDDMMEMWLAQGDKTPVRFCFSDQLRVDAAEVIKRLEKAGIAPVMVTGDRLSVAENVAKMLGMETFYAEKTPPEKFEILKGYKDKNRVIAMVGDGLNDAPALAGADVSLAPGTAIDLAQNTADIIFMGQKLAPVHEAYRLARKTQSLVKQNFTLAVIYNICVIPIAVCGFVTPLVAAAAMSGSSLIVVLNSFRVRS